MRVCVQLTWWGDKEGQQAGHTDSQTSGSHVVKCIYTQSVQHSFMILKLRPLEVSFQLEEPEPRFPHKALELQTTSKRARWYCLMSDFSLSAYKTRSTLSNIKLYK